MTEIDDKLLEQQEQEQKERELEEQEQEYNSLGTQFEGDGKGHDKESETPIADEELKQYQQQEQPERQEQKDEDEELAAIKLTKDDIDFIFQTMTKESKYDELSIKQTVHGLNSAFTRLPIPHVSTSKESGW